MTNNTLLRANLIGGMNSYIKDVIGDEDFYLEWLSEIDLPEEFTERDVMQLADLGGDSEFKKVATLFAKFINYAL